MKNLDSRFLRFFWVQVVILSRGPSLLGSPHLPYICCPLLAGLAQNPCVPNFPERTTQAGKTRSQWVDWPVNGTGAYMPLPCLGPTNTWRPEPPSTPPCKEDHTGRSQTDGETNPVVSPYWLYIRPREWKVFKNRDGAQAPLQTNNQIPGRAGPKHPYVLKAVCCT